MNQTTTNPGKGLGVGGFVLSLVAIVGYFIVAGIAALQAATTGGGTTTMIVWCIICALALLLSFMGYRKSRAVNMKNGIGMAGIIISAVALILSVWSIVGIREVATNPDVEKARQDIRNSLEEMQDEMQHSMDSLQQEH